MSRILVTGANGFVGRFLCAQLTQRGFSVRGALRRFCTPEELDILDKAVIGDIGSDTCWKKALSGVDCVVHLAARVHVMVSMCLSFGDSIYNFTFSVSPVIF